MKKREPIYAENYISYFPSAESVIALEIITVMIDIFYFLLAIECASIGAIILFGVLLFLIVSFTVAMALVARWMENEKITVSRDGVIFENKSTGKTKGFDWANVAAVEYVGYDNYRKKRGYKIYLKKDGTEVSFSKKPDYYIHDANVDRHKLAAFIPQGLHIVESKK